MNQRKSAVILGAQWGDEGKGKIVDVLSEKFSVVARYAGGHNAGHTVIIKGKKFVLQLIPCGVLRPECKGVIGNGVVLDPMAFLNEVKKLKDAGLPVDGQLFVSNRAQVILPYHRMIELAAENAPGRTKIGTTSRGIGPAYEDKMHRSGLRVVDLLNSALLRTHIENACHEKNTIAHALFGTEPLDPKTMYEEYARAAEQVAPFVTDTAVMLNKAIDNGEKVMFEGAQGALLDIDHGTYPFVTSSSATAGGAVTGTGVGPTRIGTVIGVTKAYVTRVGEGPFPTEIHDDVRRPAARARAGVRRGDRASAPLRLAGPAAAALQQHDQRHRVAGRHQDGRDGRVRRDPGLHRLQDRRQGDRRHSRRHARVRRHRAGLHDAEGLEDLDRGHHRVRQAAEAGAGLSHVSGEGVRREDRHGFDRAGPRPDDDAAGV